MFSVTLRYIYIPKSKEAWIICLVDKYCATIEYIVEYVKKIRGFRQRRAYN